MEKYMIPCLFKVLFGVDCLGCGAQRALVALFRGEFEKAFYLYPAIYTLIPWFLLLFLRYGLGNRGCSKVILYLGFVNVVVVVVSYFLKLSKGCGMV